MELFAATAPGIAPIAAKELTALGIVPGETTPDGVSFPGDFAEIERCNRQLRTASRVLVRMGRFRARTFGELERHAAKLDWTAFVDEGGAVTFRITARKCRLYHTAAIAERLALIAGARLVQRREDAAEGEGVPPDDRKPQLFIVRALRDEWLVSADSSGEHLHRRGYRLATARAPLRETLAAAAVLGSGWDPAAPLVDPFCGSGTICVEAAMIAASRWPGLERDFAFVRWPSYTPSVISIVESPVVGAPIVGAPIVFGYDRDAGAVQAARDNAQRAGVAEAIDFARQALSDLEPQADRGWIVTNPPYGVRVGERGSLRALYSRFGDILRERCGGWRVAFFSPDPALERATGLSLRTVLRTENGGLRVRLVQAEV